MVINITLGDKPIFEHIFSIINIYINNIYIDNIYNGSYIIV